MSRYSFDTDHLSLHQRNPQLFTARLQALLPAEPAITVITAEEQLRGRFLQISQAKSDVQLSEAYRHLGETIHLLNQFDVLEYDDAACRVFWGLRQQKLRIGTADLRIAAIALAAKVILVTRNHIHFSQVPGLQIEDWTK